MLEVVDSVVVGGGPAGLSAALNLARHDRTVVLFDAGFGRSTHHQVNRNYLGFPGGVAARALRHLGRQQLAEYDQVRVVEGSVGRLERSDRTFVAATTAERLAGRSVVLCTGVRERYPTVPGWEDYVGRSMFWCITCDGYESRGKRVVVVGDGDEAATVAMQLWRLSPNVTLLANGDRDAIGPALRGRLAAAAIDVTHERLEGLEGQGGIVERVCTSGGVLEADAVFVAQGAEPRSELAASIGVTLAPGGWIHVDTEQKTDVAGCFAAGDVTSLHSHQVATAVHEGSQAAAAANHHLYPEELRAP